MGWYADLKIRNKLLLGYAAVVLLSCVIGFYGINGMRSLKAHLDDTHDNLLVSIIQITDVQRYSQQHKRELLRYLLASDPKFRREILGRIKRVEGEMKQTLQDFDKNPLLPKERQMSTSLHHAQERYFEAAEGLLSFADTHRTAEAAALENEQVAPLFRDVEDLTEQLRSFNVAEADEHDAVSEQEHGRLQAWLIGLLVVLVGLSVAVALVITRSVASPLSKGLAVVGALVRGGEEKARVTQAIAKGDLSQEVSQSAPIEIDPAGLPNDETGVLLKSLVRMNEVQRTLDRAFAGMTESLRESRKTEAGRDWLKTGMNELNALIRGDQETAKLADKVIKYLAEYLHAGVGALYIHHEETKDLELIASYAFTRRKNLGSRFKLGEGLIGQAAAEGKSICLTNVPEDYLPISSALGEKVPVAIIAAPFLHEGKLIGALELGSFSPFSDAELDFLKQAMDVLAIGINVNLSRQRINELLTQSQAQEEELRVQQEELQQSNEELEERAQLLEQQREQIDAKNRAMEEASEELSRRAEELERISTYKSEFLANMSHELRTPLNSLMILSKLLQDNKDRNLTDKQVEYAATINSAGNDLLTLINDILDLSKIESGRLQFNYEETRMDELLGQLKITFGPAAEQKGLAFEIESPENLPRLRIDPQRTLQVLKNLVSNAFKFTQKGSVTLRAFVPDAQDNPLPVPAFGVSVSDTGIGISADKHELIFQAFQQADGSTSRKFGGTGLGLSISRQLALSMCGDIRLSSEEGKGSTFTLYLPLSGNEAGMKEAGSAAKAPVPAAPVVPPASPAQNSRPAAALPDDREKLAQNEKCILIIEDDLAFANILMRMVRDRGFKALVAADGASGCALAARFLPSAIILDVMLPGMDGWAVMQKLKDDLSTRHIPVHFLTCLEERQKAMTMGAIGFVTKPVSTEQLDNLFSTIEKAVEQTVKKLLIVEDNERETKGMRELLQQRGITISTASTGKDALRLLAADAFDCVVLDLGLADMSGFDLLEHVRGMDEKRRIPVIIHTGRELTHDEERRLRRYAESIIIKGAGSPERLLNEVTLFLHSVESNLLPDQRRMIRAVLDNEAMLDNRKVLIVDDDMRNVFSLSSVLSEKKMRVVEAENGKEALARLDENPDVNIVLMDVMMPEMDGLETTRRIRRDARFANLPIIALTAKAMKGDREECLKSGASDYIAKPVDIDRLLSLMRVWLYNQG
jgi:CheY-like chemotaxis protein/signal transduction histidine kinase